MANPHILVIDDEESLRYTFESFLVDAGYLVDTAMDFSQATAKISEKSFDLIVADILLGEKTGVDILEEIRKRGLNCPVILVTGYPNVETASEALRLGAFDYLAKPVKEDDLLRVVRLALQYKTLAEEKEKYFAHVEAMFRSVEDGIVSVDQDLRVIAVNRAATELCDFQDVSPVKKSYRTLASGCNKRCSKLLENTVKTKQAHEIKRNRCQSGGNPKIMTLRTSPLIGLNGQFIGAMLVIHDETQLDLLEKNLSQRRRYGKIIGQSRRMQEIYSLIDNLANIKTTVLITGETGTGKELLVETMHLKNEAEGKPLVKVNCAALPESLLESELFGHVKGAFTGAVKDKVGRFELADGGTILLDEIADISPRIQLRLLRVLQEQEFERVGDSRTIKTNARVVAATNQDLAEKVAQNEFRKDLYYRINVMEIKIPPLRERKEDISLLTEHFIEHYNTTFKKRIKGLTEAVQSLFLAYDWPGNIRELKHVLEHAFVVCNGPLIGLEHLPDQISISSTLAAEHDPVSHKNEVAQLIDALNRTDWNKAKAARLLKISRQTIYRKIKEYNLQHKGG